MDAVSYSHSAKQAQRIEKFINNPDSTSGVLTQPSVIQTGETVNVPTGRTAILANTQIDGTLTVDGTVFIPSGATLDGVVEKVVSTDNAAVRFDGVTGKVQNSGVIIDDNGNVGIGVATVNGAGALQIPNIGSLGFQGPYGYIWANVKYADGYRYVTSAKATAFDMFDGNFILKTAPSGTAGNAITWTNAMTLGANGNLLVGTTTDNGVNKLQVNGSITSKSSEYKYSDLNNACTVNENTIVNNFCLNIPYNDYGYVSVSVATPYSFCMQTFTPLNAPILFIRTMAGGTWSAWVEK